MKQTREYLRKWEYAGIVPDKQLNRIIKQIRIDDINAAVEQCAKSAEMHGYYNEPCKAEGIRLKRFKRIWENRLFKVETNISIDKQSILSVADELKSELE